MSVGTADGSSVGCSDGTNVGWTVGDGDGDLVGTADGDIVGIDVGVMVGSDVGTCDGRDEGINDGLVVGTDVGIPVGSFVVAVDVAVVVLEVVALYVAVLVPVVVLLVVCVDVPVVVCVVRSHESSIVPERRHSITSFNNAAVRVHSLALLLLSRAAALHAMLKVDSTCDVASLYSRIAIEREFAKLVHSVNDGNPETKVPKTEIFSLFRHDTL